MMPFYYGSRARSVPRCLRLRVRRKTRAFNAVSFALMTVFSSGISMYAMAKLLQLLHVLDAPFRALGLDAGYIFHTCIAVSALVVLAYILLGGLSSAIYNEVLQFFLIVAGFLPLVYLGLRDVGWSGLQRDLPATLTHAWRRVRPRTPTPWASGVRISRWGSVSCCRSATGAPIFLVVQRAMAADSMAAARRTASSRAFPKMFFPFLVVLPGLIAIAAQPPTGRQGAGRAGRAGGAGGQEAIGVSAIVQARRRCRSAASFPTRSPSTGQIVRDGDRTAGARLRSRDPVLLLTLRSPPGCWDSV